MVEDAASPSTDAELLRWRASIGSRRRQGFESLVELLWRAVAGTALAGFAFPSVLAVVAICGGTFSLGQAIAVLMSAIVLMGIPSGFLAFVVNIPVTLFACVVGRLIGVTERDVWFASLVGAWSGFFACHLVAGSMGSGSAFAMVAVAVATGQVGAGAYAYRAYLTSGAADQADEVRFGLKQLFGVMTAVAIIAIVARALSERGAFVARSAMMAVGIQVTIIGLGLAASIYARRRRAKVALREAAKRMAEVAAAAPVARGTATERITRSG